jgi:hypothetical protein
LVWLSLSASRRAEKLSTEMHSNLPHEMPWVLSPADRTLPAPLDPARVPQSGGMAARLLAGISVKFA